MARQRHADGDSQEQNAAEHRNGFHDCDYGGTVEGQNG
jgi:hypothetical protein